MYITKIVSVSTTIENYLLLKFNFLCCTSLIFQIALVLEDFVCLFIKLSNICKSLSCFCKSPIAGIKVLGTDF